MPTEIASARSSVRARGLRTPIPPMNITKSATSPISPLRDALRKTVTTRRTMAMNPPARTIRERASGTAYPMIAIDMAHRKAKRLAFLAMLMPKLADALAASRVNARTDSASPTVRACQMALGAVMRMNPTTSQTSTRICHRAWMKATRKTRYAVRVRSSCNRQGDPLGFTTPGKSGTVPTSTLFNINTSAISRENWIGRLPRKSRRRWTPTRMIRSAASTRPRTLLMVMRPDPWRASGYDRKKVDVSAMTPHSGRVTIRTPTNAATMSASV